MSNPNPNQPPTCSGPDATDQATGSNVATVTKAANPSRRHVWDGISFSTDATPAAGCKITLTDGTVGLFRTWYVTASGPGYLAVPGQSTTGASLVASISGAGANASIALENYRLESF